MTHTLAPLCAAVAGLLLAFGTGRAAADPQQVELAYASFAAGDYEKSYKLVRDYLQIHSTSRRTDYMLGVSACRTGRADFGLRHLKLAREQYRVSEPQFDSNFATAIDQCSVANGGGAQNASSKIVMDKRKHD